VAEQKEEFVFAPPRNIDVRSVYHPYRSTFAFDVFGNAIEVDEVRIMYPEKAVVVEHELHLL
jgi:hypothetical protein